MRLLAILGGFLLAFITIAVVELALRIFPPPFYPYRHYLAEGAPKWEVAPTHIPTHIPTHLPPPTADNVVRYPQTFYPASLVRSEPNFVRVRNDIGQYAKGPTQFKLIFQLPDGRVAYSVKNTLDAHSRRISSMDQHDRPKSLIFLGCSFTFGMGVSDDETLPAQVERLQKTYHVYNYSWSGWGPNNLDRLVHHDDFANDIHQTAGGKAIYYFIDDHVPRVLGSLSFYRRGLISTPFLPYYYLDSAGHLQTQGNMGERGFLHYFYSFLAKSALLSYFDIDLPLTKMSHLKLVAALIDDMRKTLKEKVGVDLVVVLAPRSIYAKYLIPELDKKGISSLDYSNVNLPSYIKGQIWLPDTHPSAAYYNFMAKQIVTDLDLNH
jgi:hypothetical protein